MDQTLRISNKAAHKINPDMVGLFFEDINFAADGGLYAEMLENRSFEAVKSCGGCRNYVLSGDYLYAWEKTTESGRLDINENSPLCDKNPHYIRFTATKDGDGFANKAYDGLVLRNGMRYKISFYAREFRYLEGDIEVALTKDGKTLVSSVITFLPAQAAMPTDYEAMIGDCAFKAWNRYETSILVNLDTEFVEGCRFEIRLTKPGIVEFDMFSMIPDDAVAGIFRKDLFETLKSIRPGFLRFPGGCIVEGTSIMRRYRWKDTVGPVEKRKINTNLWATQGGNTMDGYEEPDSHYMQSYGIGFYEYFLLCELLSDEERRCLPLPVLNIGVACQFRSYETVPVDSDEFEEYVQDALDLIEFANGSTNTRYGALRAQMGHPESFHMTLLAIGNEQWNSRHVDLDERYRRFEEAIHAVYPEIKCLGTAGPFFGNDMYRNAWDYYRREIKKNPDYAFAVDEHFYMPPQWLFDNAAIYDDYDRDIAVFAGEYAGHDENLSNSVESALAEAAMLTGMERNGDVVEFASYAPLFNRIGHSQWTPDLIWFDDKKVVLTPNYYVQKLFSNYSGTAALELNGQEKTLREQKIYVSLVKKDNNTILKVVNANEEAVKLTLTAEDGTQPAENAKCITLCGDRLYPPVTATAGIDPNGPCKAVKVESMTNAELCEYRAPQGCVCTENIVSLSEAAELPAKSLSIIIL